MSIIQAPTPVRQRPAEPVTDGEGRRRRLRKIWLLACVPVALLLALAAVKLISVPIASAAVSQAFGKQDAAGMHSAASALKVVNVIEPFRAWFDDGDAYVIEGNFQASREAFEHALQLAPVEESCSVRVNLVLSIEKLYDAASAAGNTTQAQQLSQQGIAVVDGAQPGCFQAGNPGNLKGEGQQLKDAKKRLQQKQQQQKQQEQQPSPQDPQPNQSQQQRQQQLKDQQQQDQQQRQQDQQGGQGGQSGGYNGYDKPW